MKKAGKFDRRDVAFWHEGEGVQAAVLRRRYGCKPQSAIAYRAAKLRSNGPALDVRKRVFVLPPGAPDLLAEPATVWAMVDAADSGDDLAVLIDIWKPGASLHVGMRNAVEFAQWRLADARGLGVECIQHDPGAIGHRSDAHVHLIATARQLRAAGLGCFASDLTLHDGVRTLRDEWFAYADQLPASRR